MAKHRIGWKKLPPDLANPRQGVEKGTPEWHEWVAEIEKYLGRPICGRQSKRVTPCAQPKVNGRDCCRKHGGRSPRGPAHPSYRNGRRSMYEGLMSHDLQEKFTRIINDPVLLSLESDIAMIELRQLELYASIRTGLDPADALREVSRLVSDLTVAVAEGNVVSIGLAAEEIRLAAKAGEDTARLWREFMLAGEQKRKHVETEGKRLERMQVYITAAEARARDQILLAILLRAVDHVTDKKEARKVLTEVVEGIAQITGFTGPKGIPGKQEVGHGQ